MCGKGCKQQHLSPITQKVQCCNPQNGKSMSWSKTKQCCTCNNLAWLEYTTIIILILLLLSFPISTVHTTANEVTTECKYTNSTIGHGIKQALADKSQSNFFFFFLTIKTGLFTVLTWIGNNPPIKFIKWQRISGLDHELRMCRSWILYKCHSCNKMMDNKWTYFWSVISNIKRTT